MYQYEIVLRFGFLCHTGIKSVENKGHDVVGEIKRSGSVVLAVTPSLKEEGIKTGSRLFDIPKRKDIHVMNSSINRKIYQVFKLYFEFSYVNAENAE